MYDKLFVKVEELRTLTQEMTGELNKLQDDLKCLIDNMAAEEE